MAIAVVFEMPGMTAQQYDKAVADLEAKGQGVPRGRTYHVAAPADGGWFVCDVWDSQEDFDRFGQTLVPILQELGVTAAQPAIRQVHNIIVG